MTLVIYFVGFIIKMSSSIIVLVYLNGRIFQSDDDIRFEGPKKAIQIKCGVTFDGLKKRIRDKVKLDKNESISTMTCRFLVAGKYIARIGTTLFKSYQKLQISHGDSFTTFIHQQDTSNKSQNPSI